MDPSTAILEVAVHKTFRVLDMVPHILTSLRIEDPGKVHVVEPGDVPNPNWLRPGIPGAGQQSFGDGLLNDHLFVLIPSAVSTHSWNLIFDPLKARNEYSLQLQEPFALDTRLHPPAA
jgi:RES domain-containing protein